MVQAFRVLHKLQCIYLGVNNLTAKVKVELNYLHELNTSVKKTFTSGLFATIGWRTAG
jgi:hypothetical protein